MRKHEWKSGQVFVFGSNLLGFHNGGAAKFAWDKCGAATYLGQGISGKQYDSRKGGFYHQVYEQSYALPTCSEPGIPLTLEEVAAAVKLFIAFANIYRSKGKPDIFFVTAVGCGIAGFTNEEIAPLFKNAPENCILPPEWDEFYV